VSEEPEDRVEESEAGGSSEAPVPSASDETSDSDSSAAEAASAEESVEAEPEAQPVAEVEAEPEPVAAEEGESPAEPEPVAEEAPEPAAEAEAEAVAETEPVAEAEPAAEVEPAAATTEPTAEEEYIEEEPREKPAIPGADLIPDIVAQGDQFLDAEALAAAEAEAEEAAARAAEEDPTVEAQPIADAAIDLAAGARYTATGKRKTAVARVILKPGSGTYVINGKPLDDFFPRETLQRVIRQPLETVGYESRMDVVARMHGGGVSAQAGALRHGISRALIVADPHLRGELKRRGFLTRDPRVKERKKAGLKKARKRPQFSKR
jgi:small subunit ribosomal protein S9